MRTTKRGKFAAIAVGLSLVIAACGDDDKKSDEPTDTTSDGTEAPGSTEAPAPSGGSVTYAAEQEYISYNNGTADQTLFANTLVLNMVQPGPFISMPDLTFKLWDDMMVSADVTSTDPQVVEYVIQPAAVWSDGEAIDCDDFFLAWIANSGMLQTSNPDYDPANPEAVDADGNPIPEFIPDFTCVDTTTVPEVTMDFRVGSADISADGWIALSLNGTFVVTATPSTDQCEVSVLTYTLTGEPVG